MRIIKFHMIKIKKQHVCLIINTPFDKRLAIRIVFSNLNIFTKIFIKILIVNIKFTLKIV